MGKEIRLVVTTGGGLGRELGEGGQRALTPSYERNKYQAGMRNRRATADTAGGTQERG